MRAARRTAAMDPWTVLGRPGGERSLFGFCTSHHGLGSLSWVLSTPVLHLDGRAGVARTRSGTVYLLGRRVSVDDLLDRKANVALRELGGARGPNSRDARLWLTACKTARWLGLPAPAWSDAAAVAAFLEKHRSAYGKLRAESGLGAGSGPLPYDEGVILRATHRGAPVTVARADRGELTALAGPARSTEFRDEIEDWNLVAIRGLEKGTEVHALGRRVALGNEWITSPIAAVSPGPTAVETASGHSYRLARQDGARMEPALLEHLAYALRSWGFDNIRTA